jgi:hypothetical protein
VHGLRQCQVVRTALIVQNRAEVVVLQLPSKDFICYRSGFDGETDRGIP